MKRAVKLTLTGNLQSMFTRLYFKDQAKANKINGFFRNLDSGKVELFLEGQHEDPQDEERAQEVRENRHTVGRRPLERGA